jgi:hypothetical protein
MHIHLACWQAKSWKEEWDRDLLPKKMIFHGFEMKLKGLKNKDLETGLLVSDVLTQFKTNPFKFAMPKCRFCKNI